jgi:hypothetical protein
MLSFSDTCMHHHQRLIAQHHFLDLEYMPASLHLLRHPSALGPDPVLRTSQQRHIAFIRNQIPSQIEEITRATPCMHSR